MTIRPLLTIGFPMREDAWNNLDPNPGSHILIATVVGGGVGLIVAQGMNLIAERFDYRSN